VSPDDARARFAGARVARLATAGADGRPHIVPIVFVLDGDRVYSVVDQKPKRTTQLRRLRNITENSQVAMLVDHYEDDWDGLWWVRADGRARVLDPENPEHHDQARQAIDLLRARYPQQRATGAVLVIDVERWSGWSASELR
jgi:PPOX class probable F420-dependent enzyme